MIKTAATCASQCWMAREPDCSCSCGGVNHGIMATEAPEGGTMPRRNCLIQGTRYYLGAMDYGGPLQNLASKFRSAIKDTYGYCSVYGARTAYVYAPAYNEPGAVLWQKIASESQARWPEIVWWMTAAQAVHESRVAEATAARAQGERVYVPMRHSHRRPDLLWVREDLINAFDAYREGD